jgi:hypothetical protein
MRPCIWRALHQLKEANPRDRLRLLRAGTERRGDDPDQRRQHDAAAVHGGTVEPGEPTVKVCRVLGE